MINKYAVHYTDSRGIPCIKIIEADNIQFAGTKLIKELTGIQLEYAYYIGESPSPLPPSKIKVWIKKCISKLFYIWSV